MEYNLINKYHVSMLPYFLDRLKNTQEGDSNLLDKTMIMYGSPMADSNIHNHRRCPLILLGPKQFALLIDGEAKPFDPAAFGACVAAAPGYSMGFDAAVRAQSITDTVRFLQRSLRP